ncbi:Replicative DNA helicase (plasmid) [Streptomyces sp. enrichment culture]
MQIVRVVPSALFTFEAGRNEIGARLLSAEARVALHHMRSGTMTDEDWTRLARRMPDVSAAPFCIQDGAYSNLHDLRARCRYLHSRMDVRLIAVDAVHLLTYGTRPQSSRYEEISEIARCLSSSPRNSSFPSSPCPLSTAALNSAPTRSPCLATT